MMRSLFALLAVLCSLCIGCSPNSHYTSAELAAERVPIDPGIVRGTLDNGFRYWLRSTNASGSNHTIELRLIVNAGSVDEGDSERGYAHLLEHVVFRAAESKASLNELVAEAGLRWGADVNAHTFPDHTEYRFSFSAERAELLPRALAFASTILNDLDISATHVEPEKRIVEAEWRNRRGANPNQQSAYLKQWYAGTRWLERPPLGDLGDLRRASAAPLQRFWQRYYTPANARLIVTGKLDPISLTADIKRHFGDIAARPAGIRADASQRPVRASLDAATMTDPRAVEPTVSVTISRPLRRLTDFASLQRQVEERLAFRVLQRMMSSGVRASNDCAGYATHTANYPRRWSAIRFRAVPIGNGTFEGCANLLQTLLVSARPILDTHLKSLSEKASADILNEFQARKRQSPNDMARSLVQSALLEAVPLAPDFGHKQAREVVAIAAEPQRLLARIDSILQEPRFFTATAPTAFAQTLPSSSDLLAAVQAATPGTQALIRYRQTMRPAAPARDVSTTLAAASSADGQYSWVLSNGVRVFFFPSSERKGVVALHLLDAGGYADMQKAFTEEAMFLPSYHSSVAYGELAASAVHQLGRELHLHFETEVGADWHSIEGLAASEHFGGLMKIVKATLAPLASDSRTWKFKDRARQWQRAERERPGAAVRAQYWRHMASGAAVSLTQRRRFSISQGGFASAHRELFQTAREPVVAIFGDVSSRRVESLLLDTFGAMKARADWRDGWRYRQQLSPTHERQIELEVGQNPGTFQDTADVYLFHHCTNRDERYDQFVAAHQVLAEILSTRLRQRIREELGLSYSARASLSMADKYQQVARYRAEFVTGSRQHDLLMREIERVLRELGGAAIDEAEIAQVVRKIEAERLLMSKYPSRRAAQLARRLARGLSPEQALELSLDRHRDGLEERVAKIAGQCFGEPDNGWLTVTRRADGERAG